MAEHVIPRAGQVRTMGLQISNRQRHADSFEPAFLGQNIKQDGRLGAGLRVAVEIHDVIEIARARPFGERSYLFGKGFRVGVGKHLNAIPRRIAVWVMNRHPNGVEHQCLVGRQVQLDVRNAPAAGGDRAAVGKLDLTGQCATRVPVEVEFLALDGQFQSCLLIDPCRDPRECTGEKARVQMPGIPECEVEVLRKPIGFEKALLEAGPSLENPVVREVCVLVDARQNPTQHVVLFDNLRRQRFRGPDLKDFAAVNHGRCSGSSSRGPAVSTG